MCICIKYTRLRCCICINSEYSAEKHNVTAESNQPSYLLWLNNTSNFSFIFTVYGRVSSLRIVSVAILNF